MVDHTLHGNCEPCPACALRREDLHIDLGAISRPEVPCNICGGTGLAPISVQQIVQRQAEDARRNFWPDRERAYQRHNHRQVSP
jgi:hypothetical protein